MTTIRRSLAFVLALTALFPTSGNAFLLREFRKFPREQQSLIILGGVSMAAYTRATQGDTKGARCIQDYFFGPNAKGPDELVHEIAAAERLDPDKYHVEGLILGFTDRVCPVAKPPAP